jgi:predicted RNase H-like HicB family nuclease
MTTYDYLVLVHIASDGGYWSEVPALPGCGSQGGTMDEVVIMTKDAIQGFIESMRKHGDTPPADPTQALKVTVAA